MSKKRHRLSKGHKEVAMIISMYIRNEMENFHVKHLSDEQMHELNPIIRNSVATVLYAIEEYPKDRACSSLVDFQFRTSPKYWEQPELTQSFLDLVRYFERERGDS